MNNLYDQMVGIIHDRRDDRTISVQTVSRAFYDRLLTKDPMTIYVITETGEMYRGDIPMGGFEPLRSHSRYMTLRKTSSGTEYVIMECRDKGMIEICSYKDPQEAIDFLNRSISEFDISALKRDVITTLQVLRYVTYDLRGEQAQRGFRRVGEKSRAIQNILRLYLKMINREYFMNDLDQIFKQYPDVAENIHIGGHREKKTCSSSLVYRAYQQIWILLLDERFLRREFNGDTASEERWIENVSDEIISILIDTFRDC